MSGKPNLTQKYFCPVSPQVTFLWDYFHVKEVCNIQLWQWLTPACIQKTDIWWKVWISWSCLQLFNMINSNPSNLLIPLGSLLILLPFKCKLLNELKQLKAIMKSNFKKLLCMRRNSANVEMIAVVKTSHRILNTFSFWTRRNHYGIRRLWKCLQSKAAIQYNKSNIFKPVDTTRKPHQVLTGIQV